MRSFSKGKWMTIKIDLEKAYDRVRWDFINTSLQVADIPTFLINVIMSSISNSSMQVLWNRVPLSKFKLAKGIRQGCSLSPYLFILCMDWLGQAIHSAISEGCCLNDMVNEDGLWNLDLFRLWLPEEVIELIMGHSWSSREIVNNSFCWATQCFSPSRVTPSSSFGLPLEEQAYGSKIFLNTDGTVCLDTGNASARRL
ncbi:hypothetical protein J1N35_025978 [Gossypium stocksii]|uniref:Reverse transcriptase domain-containing protein n=1 Tax=Gossypium stocksii TaxID=47602 RepID=A0A9D3ZWP3_9ROSI|nr:hypothetical protein J1N35_025978 [Gossypium stocksii]